jgi:riboflavin kinase/FMN adenylyltransferase
VIQDGLRVSSTEVRKALARATSNWPSTCWAARTALPGACCTARSWPASSARHRQHPAQAPSRAAVRGLPGQHRDRRQAWPGVGNIGVRPTVAGDGAPPGIHLLDFAGDLYGRRLTVEFHHKLREEQRFASLEALKSAIDADIAAARATGTLNR